MEEEEGRVSKRVKAKRTRASSDKQLFFFISWMEERCGLGFKREGGLGRGGLMRKGSLVNGQGLSKKEEANTHS